LFASQFCKGLVQPRQPEFLEADAGTQNQVLHAGDLIVWAMREVSLGYGQVFVALPLVLSTMRFHLLK
jgi:hypothetical protein